MIYVDDANIKARVGRIRGVWCHLISWPPDKDELVEFAEGIGLKAKWFQEDRCGGHFDVTASKKTAALAAGARPITTRTRIDWIKSMFPLIHIEIKVSKDGVNVISRLNDGPYPETDLPPRSFMGKEKR